MDGMDGTGVLLSVLLLLAIGVWTVIRVGKHSRDRVDSESERKRLEVAYPSEIVLLAEYVTRQGTALQMALDLLAPDANDASQRIDTKPKRMVLSDLLQIVSTLTKVSSAPSSEQVALLRAFSAASSNSGGPEMSGTRTVELVNSSIEDSEIELRALKILGAMDHIERHSLRDMYISFAALAAGSQTNELTEVIELIRMAARNVEEVARDARQLVDDVRQSLEDQVYGKYREALGIEKDASSLEIKAAHHRLVRLWHPDRLHEMEPEWQAIATEKIKDINEAYAVLSEIGTEK
jgi:hypothetical protein